ncbi:MAG: TIGR04150 pseudo-rSAM protein [Bacteroidales bacterium]|nr:TIGR04150 pseudo-rSAM protein [Bacteroidales bacterium]
MKDNSPWLFLEPYVQMVRKRKRLLLYNTVSKVAVEYMVSRSLAKLADSLLDPSNGYVVRLAPGQLKEVEIQEFITRLRQEFMGDLLDPDWSAGKPATIFPEPMVKFGFNPLPIQQTAVKPAIDLRNYLQEITLFLNSAGQETEDLYRTAFRQFSYPACVTDNKEEMDIDLFRRMIKEVNNYTPTLIHLSGENLARYPFLNEVIGIMAASPFQKKYHLLAVNLDKELISMILSQKHTTLSLYIRFPVQPGTLTTLLQSLPEEKLLKRLEFNLIVSNQGELQQAIEIAGTLDRSNIFFKPLFTGMNLDFFRENVFVSREEILASQPDQQQLFSRISINENDFGKLWILPGGKVFANLNDPEIGEATTETLVQLVSRELNNGISWRRIRKDVIPCKHCVFQFLCPPISSYEIFMNRFNFCDVSQNEKNP